MRNKTIPHEASAPLMEHKFSEVLVESDQEPRLGQGFFQNRIVSKTGMGLMNPQHIVPSTPQQGDAVSRDVFVSAQTHRVFSLARGGKDPFLTQQVSRVSQAGAHVFSREAGIIPQNFFLAPSFGEQIQYELNRQTGSSNDGLAGQNRRVSADVVMPVHDTKLPLFNEGSKVFLTPKKCRRLGDEELYEGSRVGPFPYEHRAAGRVNRRFESRVTIMVGYSRHRPTVSTWAGEQKTLGSRRL